MAHTIKPPSVFYREMESRFFLDVVVCYSVVILQQLASEDEMLLICGSALGCFDRGLQSLDGVVGVHVDVDGLPCGGAHEDLHAIS